MSSNLPKQRLTFFFSDIEQSTALLAEQGESYAQVLQEYHNVIRMVLSEYGGQEVDTAGDGFFVVFGEAHKAAAAALLAQRAFAVQAWSRQIGFRVRMGIHTGDAIAMPSGYIGLEVHRASRICSAAHGGQILLSQPAVRSMRGAPPHEAELVDLGEFLLRGFQEPERLYQLTVPGLPAKFPPPRTEKPMPTIAVLPFVNLNPNPDKHYLGDGIAEEIIIALSKVPGLQVVARSSSFALKGQQLDVREAGRRLNASAVLEGSVQEANGKLRITASLVDAITGYNIWSGSFHRKMEDIFTVQDEIAENIAGNLKIKLISKRIRSVKSRQTQNIRAYDFYLRGRQHYYQFSPQGINQAMELFRQAIAIDQAYALAYCGLANCYAYHYMYMERKEQYLLAAGRASRRAVEIDPWLGEAHVAYGQALSLERHYEEARLAFEKALELDPKLFEARYLFARLLFIQGKLEDAAYWFEEANRARPEDFQSLLLAGQVYADLGRADKASAARRRGVEVAESRLLLDPDDSRALYLGANGLVALGETEKGLEWARQSLALAPEDPMVLYNAGCVFALLGRQVEAMECLEKAYEKGISQREWYENDSNLDGLRGLPQFRTLLERIAEGVGK
ncbi:MAG: tetratricopeptide repeat protein [Lewinellaceae bacterium]|nr:tetratricopeptide repeat protein [Phaeodactylibacter sp.]MCB9038347.1 tetratricopeptide repeat protein [Lewinellaceae bacterium]